jgi:Skp family chaperone for outer membrane proteins
MTKKSPIARTILVVGSVFLGIAGMDAALAAPPQAPGGGAPVAKILIIDLRKVMGSSKVGRDIQSQVEALKREAQGELNGEGASLRAEETQLQQQAAILAPDVKARKIKEWQARAASFQTKVNQRSGLIQGGVIKAQQQIEQALDPILEGIMRERGATVLLDRSSVLLAPNAIDVTEVVTQRLDVKMPSVRVQLAPPPAGVAPPQSPQ